MSIFCNIFGNVLQIILAGTHFLCYNAHRAEYFEIKIA